MTLLQTSISIANPLFFESALGSLFKLFFILGALLYLIFSIVVIRQIIVMQKTVVTTFSPVITLIGWIHFFLALGLLLFYFFI